MEENDQSSCFWRVVDEIERVYPYPSELKHIDKSSETAIDSGAFGDIYNYKDNLIVKVYVPDNRLKNIKRKQLLWALDETIGSLQLKYGLTPIEVVWIPSLQRVGLIKQYIPYDCSMSQYGRIQDEIGVIYTFDTAHQQFRVDSDHNIHRVDTQTILANVIRDLDTRNNLDSLYQSLLSETYSY